MTNIYIGPAISVLGLGGMAYGAMELSKAKNWQDAVIPTTLIGVGAIAAYAGYIASDLSLQVAALTEPESNQSVIEQPETEEKPINTFEAPIGTIFEYGKEEELQKANEAIGNGSSSECLKAVTKYPEWSGVHQVVQAIGSPQKFCDLPRIQWKDHFANYGCVHVVDKLGPDYYCDPSTLNGIKDEDVSAPIMRGVSPNPNSRPFVTLHTVGKVEVMDKKWEIPQVEVLHQWNPSDYEAGIFNSRWKSTGTGIVRLMNEVGMNNENLKKLVQGETLKFDRDHLRHIYEATLELAKE